MILCACGCGQLIPGKDSKGRIHLFVSGHNNKNKKLGPLSLEHRQNVSNSLKGKTPWNKGLNGLVHDSEETKRKKSETHKGKNINENNGAWKGEKVGYGSLHTWIRKRIIRPELCQACNLKPSQDLANITGKYTRDLSNWKYLCRQCHQILDIELGVRPSYSVIAKLRKY